MANRPQTYLDWTDGSPSKVVQPPSNFSLTGWQAGQAPPFQYMNFLFWLTDQWIQYLDPLVTEGMPDQALRLLNGGTWSFNATTGVLAWSQDFNIVIPSVPDSANAVLAGSVTLPDGYLAYVDLNSPIVVVGDTASGSNVIQNVSFVNQITTSMNVTGPGIPDGTTVTAVGANSVTISANATATALAVSLVFSAAGPLTANVAESSTFVPAFNQILFARRSGPEVYLGVNTSQMILRDKEFKPLLGSGYFTVYEASAGQNLLAGQTVYISAGNPTDPGRLAGALYKLDVSATFQAVRGDLAGVVISDVSMGDTAIVLFNGFYKYSSLTPGQTYFADPSTPGGITNSEPSGSGQKIVPIGVAATSTILIVNSSGAGFSQVNFPLFFSETIGYGNGSITSFPLAQSPIGSSGLFVFVNGLIVDSSQWSLSGQNVIFNTAPAIGSEVYADYVLSNQAFIAANQEVPSLSPNGVLTEFPILGTPTNQFSTFVYLDGVLIPRSEWSLVLSGSGSAIRFNTAPGISNLYVAYFSTAPAAGSGGSGLTGASNLGSGFPVFKSISGTNIIFNTLVAGSGFSISDDGMGNLTCSATGGGTIEAHGSFASPITILAGSGITPTTATDQVWFVRSSGGAVNITANPQIAPGTSVGQRLKLKGVSATNYIILANGTGLNQNGPASLTDNQAIEYSWDGSTWSEDSRRV